jgi:hypothetical protein
MLAAIAFTIALDTSISPAAAALAPSDSGHVAYCLDQAHVRVRTDGDALKPLRAQYMPDGIHCTMGGTVYLPSPTETVVPWDQVRAIDFWDGSHGRSLDDSVDRGMWIGFGVGVAVLALSHRFKVSGVPGLDPLVWGIELLPFMAAGAYTGMIVDHASGADQGRWAVCIEFPRRKQR